MNWNWNRADLKRNAKESFRKNYWACVIVSLVILLITAGGGAGSGRGATTTVQNTYDMQSDMQYYNNSANQAMDEALSVFDSFDRLTQWGIWMIVLAVVLVIGLIAVIFSVFVGNILEVGGRRFYIENLYSHPGAGRLGYGFTCGYYWNIVKVMFLRQLFIFLWSLLFVIPGIIKAYEYYMVPDLLAEYPDMTWSEASARSREMMRGNKWNTFILEISFWPWVLLSAMTLGIAGVLYVNPYVDATKAELYDVLAGGGNQNYGNQSYGSRNYGNRNYDNQNYDNQNYGNPYENIY